MEQKAKKPSALNTQKSDPKQRNIASFFQKKAVPAPTLVTPAKRSSDASDAEGTSRSTRTNAIATPAPPSSSPLTLLKSSQQSSVANGLDKENGMDITYNLGLVTVLTS